MRSEPMTIPHLPRPDPEPKAKDPWREAWEKNIQRQEVIFHESCAIANYFRDHPDATTVMMTCGCSRCSPRC